MDSIAERIISFNRSLNYTGALPDGIRIMNPYRDDYTLGLSSEFYRKYYSDNNPRHLILGINPGRFGAGVTGIPFTDTKRLRNECGLCYEGKETHEPSSVFVYDVINAYGGAEQFYRDFFIGAVCPLGFTITDARGREKNYNYYDSVELTLAVYDFIVENLKRQLTLGIISDVCFCFGTGKNEKFLQALNQKHNFFGMVTALEHPRFVMQYRAKSKDDYISKYISAFDCVHR